MLFLSFFYFPTPPSSSPSPLSNPPFFHSSIPPYFAGGPPSSHTLMPTPSMTDFRQYTQDFLFYSPELELELPTSGSVVHSLIHLTTQAGHANLPLSVQIFYYSSQATLGQIYSQLDFASFVGRRQLGNAVCITQNI